MTLHLKGSFCGSVSHPAVVGDCKAYSSASRPKHLSTLLVAVCSPIEIMVKFPLTSIGPEFHTTGSSSNEGYFGLWILHTYVIKNPIVLNTWKRKIQRLQWK